MSENGSGGSIFGKLIGYLILGAAILAVICWFIVMPALEERGISREDIGQKAEEIKDKVSDTAGAAGAKIKDMTGRTGEAAAEAGEKVGEKLEEAGEKLEEAGEKAGESAENALEIIEL